MHISRVYYRSIGNIR